MSPWKQAPACSTPSCPRRAVRRGRCSNHQPRPKVTIVAGPPGAGKTYWVRERARAGDLIVDLDRLVMALSTAGEHERPPNILHFALPAYEAVVDTLAIDPRRLERAWVIGTLADKEQRDRLAKRLRARVVVLDTPADDCKQRVSDRPASAPWPSLIDRWHREYVA